MVPFSCTITTIDPTRTFWRRTVAPGSPTVQFLGPTIRTLTETEGSRTKSYICLYGSFGFIFTEMKSNKRETRSS
ncbi:hypothetical protein RIF29_20332 [Crotalaria pallida]|uniref:Uncharacterized protein n=1 Tax=Crotalaria pallida TaxID=3830 RepID=A0AAN9I7D5_CROPI